MEASKNLERLETQNNPVFIWHLIVEELPESPVTTFLGLFIHNYFL